jgi:hypothetical protein
MINQISGLNLFFSFVHFLLCYGVLMTLIVTNNINILIIIFFIMIYVKLLFLTYKRCILTIVENSENNIIDDIVSITFRTLSNDYNNFGLSPQNMELIFINLALLIVVNKLGILYLLKYYSGIINYTFSYLKRTFYRENM